MTMRTMTLEELDARLAQDQEYIAGERELRPDLNLANDVVDFRVEKGWTQANLAQEVGTNQANISRLESALANPTMRFLKKLARALGAELEVRLKRAEDMPGRETMEAYIASLGSQDTAVSEHTVKWTVRTEAEPTSRVSTKTGVPC